MAKILVQQEPGESSREFIETVMAKANYLGQEVTVCVGDRAAFVIKPSIGVQAPKLEEYLERYHSELRMAADRA